MRPILTVLIALSIAVFCASAVSVSKLYPGYHIAYDAHALTPALVTVALFAPVFLVFVVAEFSLGYFVGFYFCSMVLGYLWLTFFSLRTYDHETARLSAVISMIVFLLPALFVRSPLPEMGKLSVKTFDRLLLVVFLVCAATVAVGAAYNFRFVSPDDASTLRTDALPTYVNYLVGITSGSLLPFLFAYCVARKAFWRAGAVVLLMLLYYPVAVSKMAFFAPAWLIVLAVLARFLETRVVVVLSLLLPIMAGVLLFTFFDGNGPVIRFAAAYHVIVNFRLLAVPSLALDLYNEFFASHELTHFCQIKVLKLLIGCSYQDQLGVVMLKYFPGGGTYNASLFATEGIASVGVLYAPITVFFCGVVIAFGNRASAGLPPSLVLVSGAMLLQNLLNVPLSTALLTHGGALLFLLWYLTPRETPSAGAG
ncbi:hypothetical protein [Bradyrhizobium sp. LB11.1]|uniref:hypothetical protein n=1 Tax=Bradyrhizobium sp. LB11.1 TaxID=3156326 RepID=UPI0033920190